MLPQIDCSKQVEADRVFLQVGQTYPNQDQRETNNKALQRDQIF